MPHGGYIYIYPTLVIWHTDGLQINKKIRKGHHEPLEQLQCILALIVLGIVKRQSLTCCFHYDDEEWFLTHHPKLFLEGIQLG